MWRHAHRIVVSSSHKQYHIKCNYCAHTLQSASSTSGMMRHLKSRHQDKLDGKSSRSIADQLRDTPAAGSTPRPNLEDLIIRFIVLSEQPLQLVEEPAFVQLLAGANPGFKLFSRKTLKERILRYHDAYFSALKEALQDIPGKLSVSLDCSTTKTSFLPFMACIGHWITDTWDVKTVLLSFAHLPGSHTGERMGARLIEVLQRFSVLPKVSACCAFCTSRVGF